MGSKLYSRFFELVQRWPVDKTRPTKDLGERLRKLIVEEFPQGPLSQIDENKLSKDLESLNRISNNLYLERYPRRFKGCTATGLELEDLKAITSTEALDYLSKNSIQKALQTQYLATKTPK